MTQTNPNRGMGRGLPEGSCLIYFRETVASGIRVEIGIEVNAAEILAGYDAERLGRTWSGVLRDRLDELIAEWAANPPSPEEPLQ